MKIRKISLISLIVMCSMSLSCDGIPTDNASLREWEELDRVEFYPYDAGFRPELGVIGEWVIVPDVIVCRDAPVTQNDVDSAIEWWRSLGYSFASIEHDVLGGPCIDNGVFGKIIISLITQQHWDLNHLGKTLVTHHKTNGDVYGATILLHNNPPQRVLEHEIGHALGWGHYNRIGHIMHQSWSLGGYKSEGLKKL